MSISCEIDIISRLNHLSVLKFITCSPVNFKGKPKPVIITEYASNRSLSDLLDHDKKDPKNVILNDTRKLIIIYGIASAMSYLHSHNIIHRDLKPGNVLIDRFLFPKVSDFGLSKSKTLNEGASLIKTAKGNIKGTPAYISPEIWQKSEYSPLSDVYAFLIVMFEIMMNQKPYQNENFFNLISLIQQKQRPKFNSKIPAAYKNLIERCWSQDPQDRPTFKEIMKELKTNREFITEKVNESEFMNYVRYVDEYKTTFSLNNSASIRISFNKLRENNHKISDDNESIIKIEDFFGTGTHFPYKYFLQLNKENQKLVVEAELGDSEKQLIVAQNLIQSKHDFPFNTKIGIDFLRMSINNGNKKSLIYYIKMIVKGNIIPKNLKKVKKLLETSFSDDKSTYFYLYGKLFKKEKQYEKAEKYFQQSLNNCDSLYEYAEMYRKGYLQINRGIDISKYYNINRLN